MKKYKLVNKARFYSFITACIVLIFLGLLFFTNEDARGECINKYDMVEIQYGDTLWDIASRYNNNSYEDLREFVYKIKRENDIFGDLLVPNTTLRIPKA